MKKLAPLVPILLLAASACDPSPTDPFLARSLAMQGGAQVITDCTVITESGRYVLGDDLLVDDRAACVDDINLVGIRILASDVHLALAGHTIRGDGSLGLENGVGIRLGEVGGVHVTGGTIEGGGLFFDGMQTSGTDVTVTGMTIRDNLRFGIGSTFCGDCRYSGIEFTNNGNAGIQTVFAGDLGPTRISGNRFVDNGIGVTIGVFSGDVTIVGNVITGSWIGGILDFLAPQGGNTIQGNTVAGSGPNGGIFLFSSGNTVRGNQVSESEGDGIAIARGGFFPGNDPTTDNVVQANQVSGSGGTDLVDGNDGCVNTWKSNTFETDSEGNGPRTGCIQ